MIPAAVQILQYLTISILHWQKKTNTINTRSKEKTWVLFQQVGLLSYLDNLS